MSEEIDQGKFNALVQKFIREQNEQLETRARVALMFFDKSQLNWLRVHGQTDPYLQVTI